MRNDLLALCEEYKADISIQPVCQKNMSLSRLEFSVQDEQPLVELKQQKKDSFFSRFKLFKNNTNNSNSADEPAIFETSSYVFKPYISKNYIEECTMESIKNLLEELQVYRG